MAAQPGWYPDPEDPTRQRWWDGRTWGARAPEETSGQAPRAAGPWVARLPIWAWAAVAAVAVLLAILLPRLVALIALAVLIIAIVALWRGTPTWLRIPSRKTAAAVTAVSAVALVVTSGIASAQVQPTTSLTSVAETAHSEESSAPRPFAEVGADEQTIAPERTPVTSVREEIVREVVPFQEVTVDDPAMNRGETAVRSEGANGERQLTYRVTLVDGEEVSRELIGDVVSVEPVDRVIAVGTYDAPPLPPAQPEPAPLAQAGGGCDSNYADACVPIASDVDCAGGSGNGPAYFDGVARVVGSDIYDLDRDGDGYACEP